MRAVLLLLLSWAQSCMHHVLTFMNSNRSAQRTVVELTLTIFYFVTPNCIVTNLIEIYSTMGKSRWQWLQGFRIRVIQRHNWHYSPQSSARGLSLIFSMQQGMEQYCKDIHCKQIMLSSKWIDLLSSIFYSHKKKFLYVVGHSRERD